MTPDAEPSMSTARLDSRLDGVEGWLHVDEARTLYTETARLAAERQTLTIVEIGSWKGRSTISLASALELTGNDGTVWAIDPHTGNAEHRERWGEVDTFAEFQENVRSAGVDPFVSPLRMPSHEARSRFEANSVDVLFVDGSHEYDDVVQDCDDWLPALRAGALVVFNDTSWPGVYRALRARVVHGGTPFRRPQLVRSTLFLRFDPLGGWDNDEERRWRRARALLLGRRALHGLVPYAPDSMKRLANRLTGSFNGS